MGKCVYKAGVTGYGSRRVIWVQDGGSGPSVTNSAEQVVSEVVARFGDFPIVYRDSMGQWDGLEHSGGVFSGFRCLDCRSLDAAVARLAVGKVFP